MKPFQLRIQGLNMLVEASSEEEALEYIKKKLTEMFPEAEINFGEIKIERVRPN